MTNFKRAAELQLQARVLRAIGSIGCDEPEHTEFGEKELEDLKLNSNAWEIVIGTCITLGLALSKVRAKELGEDEYMGPHEFFEEMANVADQIANAEVLNNVTPMGSD